METVGVSIRHITLLAEAEGPRCIPVDKVTGQLLGEREPWQGGLSQMPVVAIGTLKQLRLKGHNYQAILRNCKKESDDCPCRTGQALHLPELDDEQQIIMITEPVDGKVPFVRYGIVRLISYEDIDLTNEDLLFMVEKTR
jgi:hypothetical protein